MDWIIGTLLLLYTTGILFHYRPVQKESWISAGLCLVAGVISLLSAPAATAGLAVAILGMQIALALISTRLLCLESRERRSAQKQRDYRHANQRPQDCLQKPRIAG